MFQLPGMPCGRLVVIAAYIRIMVCVDDSDPALPPFPLVSVHLTRYSQSLTSICSFEFLTIDVLFLVQPNLSFVGELETRSLGWSFLRENARETILHAHTQQVKA